MTSSAISPSSLLGPRLTLAEWGHLPEEVPGELVEDRLVEEETPDYLHEVIVAWLARVIGNWGEEREAIIGGSDARLAVSEHRGRKADLTVYLAGRCPPARGMIKIPPDVAVEVISRSAADRRRDRVEKRADYARFGVRCYWLIEPQQRTLEVLELNDAGDYDLVVSASHGLVDLSMVAGLEELELNLDQLWAKVDLLGD